MEELAFLRDRFLGYYRANPPPMPPRFGRREWGFMFFGGGYMMRHIAFGSATEAHDLFLRKVPSHAYYSTAYYQDPGAPRMSEKGWLGADLIFDLDADHLPGASEMSYEEQLAAVKPEMAKLLDDFILGDLGIAAEHVRLAFSGGRGYHLHVSHPGLVGLPSSARKEIIDYITGKGINKDLFMRRKVIFAERRGRFTKEIPHLVIDPVDAPGWRGRIAGAIYEELVRIHSLPEAEAVRELKAMPNIGDKSAREIVDRLHRDTWMEDVREGNIDLFRNTKIASAFIDSAIERFKVPLSGEADEPVTTDVKRLIRAPGTLHGKTGMRTVPLTIDEFRGFDPLTDALAFGDEEVAVNVAGDAAVGIGGEMRRYQAGEASVPEYVAVFMIARRMATLPGAG